ncbi:AT-rich interactive domain-containing protein 2-like isoform X2 [Rutidosis leptorrhynchoides]
MVYNELKINSPLPLVTGIEAGEDDVMPGPVLPNNFFSDYFGYTFPRRQIFHYDDIYLSLLNASPRKTIPIGPDQQADVPEYDPKFATVYKDKGGIERFLGRCVTTVALSVVDSDNKTYCECLDGGSIRCVQAHVKEARLRLRKCFGDEIFVEMGMVDMGEEVALMWTEEEQRLFHRVVYSNPSSIGNSFWKQLAIVFPYRTKKELVSYYFNVFILRRRAVQNRSHILDIDSDDDEWRGSYGGSFGEDDDLVVGDHDDDVGVGRSYDDNDVINDQFLENNLCKEGDVNSSGIVDETKDHTIEG